MATRQEGTSTKPAADALPPETCRVLSGILARLGDRWSSLVIVGLEAGPVRFNDLRRRLGISQKVLTSTLRGLERDGYVLRAVTPGKSPQVAYSLSEHGREALPPMRTLALWALSQVDRVQRARIAFDRSRSDR